MGEHKTVYEFGSRWKSQERFLLSQTLFGLGRSHRSRCECASLHAVEPEKLPVPLHLRYAGVLSPTGQTIYHVVDAFSDYRHTPAEQNRMQVSCELSQPVMACLMI